MATDFQNKVLLWHGQPANVSDGAKKLAYSTEIDGLVNTIAKVFQDVPTYKTDEYKIGFKVWRNGLCWDLTSYANGQLGRYPELSAALYNNDDELLEALRYRGAQEGFKIVRAYSSTWAKLKSLVIMFVPPDEE
ncbi:MAG: hypothetical protein LBG75_00750 [Candidatus Nomurabacteria bacterium]|jgi:hypothetical protein|nr:hypothetical protein [Candidatus Nomurabacteria bacterium]